MRVLFPGIEDHPVLRELEVSNKTVLFSVFLLCTDIVLLLFFSVCFIFVGTCKVNKATCVYITEVFMITFGKNLHVVQPGPAYQYILTGCTCF